MKIDLNRALYISERVFRIAFLPFLMMLAGCVISPRVTGNGNNNPPPTTSGGELYVATPNSILRFSQALSANGNVQPAATITGSSTQLLRPGFLHVDTTNDRLFVANNGNDSILVFNNASTLASGNIAPSAVLAGSATGLSSPVDVAIDSGNDLLYVADGTTIRVFSGQSTFSGNVNVAPVRTFLPGGAIAGILLDTSDDTLYVADANDNQVIVIGQASLQVFAAVPTALIQGSSTQLFGPNGLALDGTGRLVVSNAGTNINSTPSVTIYSSPTVANGNILPDTIIAGGNTGFAVPSQLALAPSSANGELFVADETAQKISIYNNANNLRGNIGAAPDASIAGANTGLSGVNISGMALDPTR